MMVPRAVRATVRRGRGRSKRRGDAGWSCQLMRWLMGLLEVRCCAVFVDNIWGSQNKGATTACSC